MLFKNILLGLGGSAAIGGIGYGIYSSSQTNEKENIINGGNSTSLSGPEGEPGSTSSSGDQEGNSEQQGEKTEKDGEKGTGTEGGKQVVVSPQPSPGNTIDPQNEKSLPGDET